MNLRAYPTTRPYTKPVMPGENMVVSSGIMMLVSAFYGLVSSIGLTVAYSAASRNNSSYSYSPYGPYVVYDTFRGPSIAGACLAIIVSVLALAFSIVGIVMATKRSTAKVIIIFGSILLFLGFVAIIVLIATVDANTYEISLLNYAAAFYTVPHSIILPIFYIIGGYTRSKAPI